MIFKPIEKNIQPNNLHNIPENNFRVIRLSGLLHNTAPTKVTLSDRLIAIIANSEKIVNQYFISHN